MSGRWGKRSQAEEEWALLPYLSHPVIGTVPLREVGGKVPLQERDLPAWFTDLPDDEQDACYSAWLDRVADVLDGCGATRLEISLYSFDVRAARDLGFDVEAEPVTETWSQGAWRRVFSRLNPEALRVSGPAGDLVLMFETLDGMTVSAEVARALGAAQPMIPCHTGTETTASDDGAAPQGPGRRGFLPRRLLDLGQRVFFGIAAGPGGGLELARLECYMERSGEEPRVVGGILSSEAALVDEPTGLPFDTWLEEDVFVSHEPLAEIAPGATISWITTLAEVESLLDRYPSIAASAEPMRRALTGHLKVVAREAIAPAPCGHDRFRIALEDTSTANHDTARVRRWWQVWTRDTPVPTIVRRRLEVDSCTCADPSSVERQPSPAGDDETIARWIDDALSAVSGTERSAWDEALTRYFRVRDV